MPSTIVSPGRRPSEAVPSVATTDLSTLPPWEPPASVPRGAPDSFEERVHLSLRVVVALGDAGPPGDNGSARRGSTQQGLAERLGVTQGAVSKVLSRMMAADVVREDRRHVSGLDRRVRVYSLTVVGQELEREIRDHFGLPPSGFPRY